MHARDDGGVKPFALSTMEGERIDWMGDPTLLKITSASTGGLYAVAEIVSTPQSIVPLHVHHREDEAFYILDGEVDFWVGSDEVRAGPGAFVFGPRDLPHRYAVRSQSARMLMVFSPGGFEGFIRETGAPMDRPDATVSIPEDVDLEMMLEVAARYGAEVLDG